MIRRTLLQGALACALLPGRGFGATPQGFFGRHHLPIGLQLYTVGEAVRKDLDDAFTKIAGIGFTVLEAAGYHGQTPAALREAAADHRYFASYKCASSACAGWRSGA